MSNNNDNTADLNSQFEQYKLKKKLKFEGENAAKEDLRKRRAAEEAEKKAEHLASTARIQFHLPDGSSQTQYFSADSPLSELYSFVKNILAEKYSSISLYNTASHMNLDNQGTRTSLKDLQLVPSATVMVLPLSATSSPDWGWRTLLWMILSPFSIVWSMMSGRHRTAPDHTNFKDNDKRRIYIGPQRPQRSKFIEQVSFCVILIFFIYISTVILTWLDNAP